jgi:predicted PurR-regulated permease PerM
VRWGVFLGATAFIIYLCSLVLAPFLDVFAWSAILSIAFHPVYRRLVRVTGRASLSAFLCSVLVVVAILVPLGLLTGLAVNQFFALRDYLQGAFGEGFDLQMLGPLRQPYEWVAGRLRIDTAQILEWLTQNASELGRVTAAFSLSLAANVSGAVVTFVFTIFAMFLMFRDGERMVGRIPGLLPFERARGEAMLQRIRDVIYASVYGVLVIAAIQGVLCALMFRLLGIPSAALWGMVTMVTSVIPLIGSAGVWVPGAVYLLLIGQWPQAIALVAWGGIVIGSVDNFLRPKLVGGRVGLSELVTFFALLGGLQAFGFLGIILGPVLFAVAGSIFDALTDSEVSTG